MALKKQYKARWNCNTNRAEEHGLLLKMGIDRIWNSGLGTYISSPPPHPPTHTCPTLWQTHAWLCLISNCIFCSLFLYFCTEFSWQYNAMHKFLRALDNPPPPHPRSDLSSLTIRHKHLTVNRFTNLQVFWPWSPGFWSFGVERSARGPLFKWSPH